MVRTRNKPLTFFHALFASAYQVAGDKDDIEDEQDGAGRRHGDDDDLGRVTSFQQRIRDSADFVPRA